MNQSELNKVVEQNSLYALSHGANGQGADLEGGRIYDRLLIAVKNGGQVGWVWSDYTLGALPDDYVVENEKEFKVTHFALASDVNGSIEEEML